MKKTEVGVIFSLSSVEPEESPPAGYLRECKFNVVPDWPHFSEPDVSI